MTAFATGGFGGGTPTIVFVPEEVRHPWTAWYEDQGSLLFNIAAAMGLGTDYVLNVTGWRWIAGEMTTHHGTAAADVLDFTLTQFQKTVFGTSSSTIVQQETHDQLLFGYEGNDELRGNDGVDPRRRRRQRPPQGPLGKRHVRLCLGRSSSVYSSANSRALWRSLQHFGQSLPRNRRFSAIVAPGRHDARHHCQHSPRRRAPEAKVPGHRCPGTVAALSRRPPCKMLRPAHILPRMRMRGLGLPEPGCRLRSWAGRYEPGGGLSLPIQRLGALCSGPVSVLQQRRPAGPVALARGAP